MKDALLALLGARFSFRRSRGWTQMTSPADNLALDGHPVPRRFCEQCGSDDRTPRRRGLGLRAVRLHLDDAVMRTRARPPRLPGLTP